MKAALQPTAVLPSPLRKVRWSLIFGLVTFSLPLSARVAAGLGFGYVVLSASLIGSLLASHTLIAYPIVVPAGLAKHPAIAVGATIRTDMLSPLALTRSYLWQGSLASPH